MDDQTSMTLSGRTFITRVTFATADVLRAAVGDGAIADDGRQPMAGDLRLSATIAPEYRGVSSKGACSGTLSASIFDGVCWQRFELTSLTSMCRFANADQLRAVLGWATHSTREAAGRPCKQATSASGVPIYELHPIVVQVAAPRTQSFPAGPTRNN